MIEDMNCNCYQQGKEIKVCLCCGRCSECNEQSGLNETQLHKLNNKGTIKLYLCDWYMNNEATFTHAEALVPLSEIDTQCYKEEHGSEAQCQT